MFKLKTFQVSQITALLKKSISSPEDVYKLQYYKIKQTSKQAFTLGSQPIGFITYYRIHKKTAFICIIMLQETHLIFSNHNSHEI